MGREELIGSGRAWIEKGSELMRRKGKTVIMHKKTKKTGPPWGKPE
jgi:hypothetical protein